MVNHIRKTLGYDKFNEIVETVKSMDAVDIIQMYEPLEETKRPGTYTCLCPFHNQDKKGSFTVSRSYAGNSQGGYHCFKCSSSGNGIGYVLEKFFGGAKDKWLEAVIKIAEDKGLIVLGDSNIEVKKYVKKELPKEVVELAQIKDVTSRDIVYSKFLECCILTPEDRAYLKKYRGLNDAQIDEGGYKTAPNRSIMYSEGDSRIIKGFKSFTSMLEKNELSKTDLLGIPGFYLNKITSQGKEIEIVTFSKFPNSSLLIPNRNAKGQIQAIQVDAKAKLKENYEGPKYFWWSSSKARGGEHGRMGCSPEAPIGVVYPTELRSPIVVITEGDYKAKMIAKVFGVVAITLQGVGNWHSIISTLNEIEHTDFYQCKYDSIPTIYGLFDGDMVNNYNVSKQLRDMTDAIENERKCELFYIYWDTQYGKGIDDLIMCNENYLEHLRKVRKKGWDKAYEKAVRTILKNTGAETPNQISGTEFEELIKKEFYHIAFPEIA